VRVRTVLAAAGLMLGSWAGMRVLAQATAPESAAGNNEVIVDFLSDTRGEVDPCG
jgi:hypothetical protein